MNLLDSLWLSLRTRRRPDTSCPRRRADGPTPLLFDNSSLLAE